MAPPSEEEGVLGIIKRHRQGVRLIDIGNELGVDWRSLIGVIRGLMAEGKIEKVENLYYPVEEM